LAENEKKHPPKIGFLFCKKTLLAGRKKHISSLIVK
jgi:hypothetical protein